MTNIIQLKRRSHAELRMKTTSIPRQSHTPNNDKKDNEFKKTYTDDFLNFWKVYPRKVCKGAAFKAWRKANGKPPVENLIAIVECHKQTDQWQNNNGQFIPYPATWLNQRRWEDEIEYASAAGIPESDRDKWLSQWGKEK